MKPVLGFGTDLGPVVKTEPGQTLTSTGGRGGPRSVWDSHRGSWSKKESEEEQRAAGGEEGLRPPVVTLEAQQGDTCSPHPPPLPPSSRWRGKESS